MADPIAYQTNKDGVFVGPVKRQKSPLEPGVFLVPAGAVVVEPPSFAAGEMAVWDGAAWSVKPIPVPPAPPEMQAPEAKAPEAAPAEEKAEKKEKKKKE